ncbi:dTMP kinase [Fictibacillus iocasae]|uniref:Thymidylate kinase n=1 Tax=Fictibacillus iocasae TaxID=2715437 RepID=A0ABW2NNR3_9BACL
MNGLFITLEGPDGSGKSTQIGRIADYLNEQNVSFIQTREPGGTAISDKVRELILDPAHAEMADMTEILLYAASRAQHVHEKIIPALTEGKVVLCDRFVDASIAYQGYGLQVGAETVEAINRYATGGVKPDRSYLIDVSPETGRSRMRARYSGTQLDRIEQKEFSYHNRVREGFHRLAEEQNDRIRLIDGERGTDDVFEEIKKDLEILLNTHFMK